MHSKINICLACDDNYSKYAGVVIASILKNSQNDNDIAVYILDGGISEQRKNEILSLKNIKNCEINFIDIDKNLYSEYENIPTFEHISFATFYRLKLPSILPNIKRIIYLDCDMIVVSDLKELFETDINGCWIAGCEDIGAKKMFTKYKGYVNAGMLLLDLDKMRENKAEDKFIQYLKDENHYLKHADQDIINYSLKDHIYILDERWNVQSSNFTNRSSYTHNPKIIHFIAKRKPWDLKSLSYHKNIYFEYLQLTPWKLHDEELKQALKTTAWEYVKYRPLFMIRPRFYKALFYTYIKPALNKTGKVIFEKQEELNVNRITLKILGITIKISKDTNLFRRISNSFSAVFKKYIFIKKHKEYIKQNNNKIKRLFITTGNVSLLNSLAYINQFDLWNDGENDILIYSGVAQDDFINENKKIVEQFNINNCFAFLGSSKNLYYYLLSNYYTDYNEVYFVNIPTLGNKIPHLYTTAKLYVIDEGIFTVIANKHINYNKVDGIISANYMDKFDFFNFSQKDTKKIIKLNKSSTDFIINNIRAKMTETNLSISTGAKTIIFCGTFDSLCHESIDTVYSNQNTVIENLKNKNYNILFKPHPRDINIYKETENFKILNSKMPLEIFPLDNITAVVSLYSSVSLQLFHFQNVPGYVDYATIDSNKDFNSMFIKEYAQDYHKLLETNTNMSTQELKRKLNDDYQAFINSKPKLSENQKLKRLK